MDTPTPEESANRAEQRNRLMGLALLSGLIAVICAIALPLAPVKVNQPVVSWPNDSAAPQSTLLTLGAYRPLGIDARFSCRTIAAAQGTADGTVLATVDPRVSFAFEAGLVVTAKADRLTVWLRNQKLLDSAIPAGECDYRITGDTATPLAVALNGRTVATAAAGVLPDVDLLTTSAAAVAGGTAADLSVRLNVDDRFATSPTAIKIALIVLMLLAAAAALACLIVMDRAVEREPLRRRPFRLHAVDVLVPLTMLAWLFLAPSTDDDGYYGAMAKNVTFEGYVGNYYQMYNEGFTPFSWFYVFLNFWQRLFGYAPVVLRIPALIFGLVTWWALRRLVDGQHVLPEALRGTRWGPIFVRAVLAGAFLAWWLPLDMGIRPEGVVTMCGAIALLAVSSAIERQRLALIGVAIGIGAIGVTAHPTGFTALAPVVAGLPAIWRLLRRDGAGGRTVLTRAVCVIAPGALAAFVTFADGSLRDFIRAQQIFRSIQATETWYSEYLRYQFLLQQDPMGNYAKRAAVLLCIVALVWFLALMAGARFRRVAVPGRLALAGWSTLAMFLLLWVTPSKWTHHFGALSGIGSAFLALMLVGFVPLVRRLTRDERLPVPALVLGVVSLVAALALAGHGPNLWPYNWLFGMPHAGLPPSVWKLHADSAVLWALGLAVITYLVYRWARARKPDWRRYSLLMAMPILVLIFFAANVVYLLGSFTVATARTWNTFSPSQSAVRDPLAHDCVAASAIDVLDDKSATPLPAMAGTAAPPAGATFRPNAWPPTSPPPPGGASQSGWGSWNSAPAQSTGTFTSQWYELPETMPKGGAVATLAAGRLATGNTLTVEYGRVSGSAVTVLGSRDVSDKTDSPSWRSLVLDDDSARPTGANAIRMVAVDGTADDPGWLAFTAPSLQSPVSLQRYLPEGSAIAVSWQMAFLFPCQRQPAYAQGIIEPVSYAVQWSATPFWMLGDGTWIPFRGGLFGQVPRTQSFTLLTARFRDFPGERWMQVYRFVPAYPSGQYTLTTSTQTRLGI